MEVSTGVNDANVALIIYKKDIHKYLPILSTNILWIFMNRIPWAIIYMFILKSDVVW